MLQPPNAIWEEEEREGREVMTWTLWFIWQTLIDRQHLFSTLSET